MLLNIGETKTQRQVWSGIQGGVGYIRQTRRSSSVPESEVIESRRH